MIRQVRDSDRKAGWIEVTTLGDFVDRAAEKWSHEAVVFPHERATYPEFAARTDHFARGLLALGIQPREKVGIFLTQGVDYLAIVFAAAKIGAISVPINSRFKEKELGYTIKDSEMSILFTTDDLREHVDYAELLQRTLPSMESASLTHLDLAEAPQLRHVVLMGEDAPNGFMGQSDFDEAAAGVSADELLMRRYGVSVRDTAVIMYTSGTTAAPKGAMLTHEGLLRVGVTVARTRFELTPEDRMWSALPIYHIGGVSFSFACFAAGSTYVHTGSFVPEVAVRQLAEERCTVAIPAFETIWLAVINHPDFDPGKLDSMRVVFNLGVPERLRQMQARLPHAVQIPGFGSTESSSFLTVGEIDDTLEDRVTTCGRPLPGLDVRIFSPETGEELPPGELGEIVYRGWSTFIGYYNDPIRTAESIDDEGFFHSGDLGTMDEEGRLRFVTRLKDMMKVGGENVAAAEVEGFLLGHPDVLLAQVVGAPDAHYSEVPTAFVQLKEGASLDEQDIIDFCLGKIATFKVPRYVRFVDEWPMSGTKIKKHVLRDRIADELSEAGITEAPRMSSQAAHT